MIGVLPRETTVFWYKAFSEGDASEDYDRTRHEAPWYVPARTPESQAQVAAEQAFWEWGFEAEADPIVVELYDGQDEERTARFVVRMEMVPEFTAKEVT